MEGQISSIYNEKLYIYRSYVHSEKNIQMQRTLKYCMLCKVSPDVWVKWLKNPDLIKMQKKKLNHVSLLLVFALSSC